jgi:predicted ATPase
LQMAEATQDLRSLCHAYQAMATAYLQRGEPVTSLHYFCKIREVEARLDATYQPDVTSRARMGEALWLVGHPDQARQEAAEALRLAEEQRHPHGQVHARDLVMCVYQRLADIPTVSRLTTETITLAEQFGFPNYAAAAKFLAGWAMAQKDSLQAGLQQMVDALATSEQIEERFNLPYFLGLVAQVQAQNGQLELALQTIAAAQQEVEKSGDRLWQAELVRLTGEFRQRLQDEPETVAGLYRTALAIARQQGAKSLELRAAISLARLAQTQRKERNKDPQQDNEAAHHLLAEVYGWFTEGLDTADLQEARSLLMEIA